jgi:RNA polymerase sigma factor (sigma-70 family)
LRRLADVVQATISESPRPDSRNPVLFCTKISLFKKIVHVPGNRMTQTAAKLKPYNLMQQLTDQELVSGVLQGNPKHQAALYQQYSVPMFRVLLRFARDRAEAEDMLQEGFIRVYRDMAQFRAEGALGGWIRRIMVNTALSHLRRQRDFIRNTADFTPYENQFRTEEDFVANLDAQTLLKYLQQLPPGYRAVFNLYAIDGFSHEEIAEQLGISIGTSKSQLFKAREYLKRILDKSFIT